MQWILRWTGGHPYLTLRVVRSLDESPPPSWTERAVDERIAELFFSPQRENDSNLQFVRDMLTKNALDKEAVLRTYRNVWRGQRVPDRELDEVATWLKLSGIVWRDRRFPFGILSTNEYSTNVGRAIICGCTRTGGAARCGLCRCWSRSSG